MARRKVEVTREGRRDNGTGTIYKLSGKRRKPWVARSPLMDIDGEMKQPFIGTFKTRKEAEDALRNCKYVYPLNQNG